MIINRSAHSLRFPGFALSWVLVFDVFLFCSAHLGAQIPEPPSIGVSVRYYDLEGKAGFLCGPDQGDPLLQGSFMEVYRQGSTTPDNVVEGDLDFYEQRPYSEYGWPYFFRCVIPAVGVFEGSGVTNSTESYPYCLPVRSEEVGRSLELESHPLTRAQPEFDCYVSVMPWITNSLDYSGAVGAAGSLGLADATCSITMEYLPGNSLEPLGSSTATFKLAGQTSYSLYWGTYYPEGTDPGTGIMVLGRVAPEGPVRATIFMDGYQTDQVEATLANHYTYGWHAVLRPKPDRPDAKRPPSSYTFAPVPISREVERGILDANARTHILMDDNRDGVIDIADLVHARRNE